MKQRSKAKQDMSERHGGLKTGRTAEQKNKKQDQSNVPAKGTANSSPDRAAAHERTKPTLKPGIPGLALVERCRDIANQRIEPNPWDIFGSG